MYRHLYAVIPPNEPGSVLAERARDKWWLQVIVGFVMGTATVLLAARPVDDWRLSLYYAVSAISGLYLGGANGRWGGRTAAAVAGHFATAFVLVWPYLQLNGLALYWPLFKVPIAVALMVSVAALIAVLGRSNERAASEER